MTAGVVVGVTGCVGVERGGAVGFDLTVDAFATLAAPVDGVARVGIGWAVVFDGPLLLEIVTGGVGAGVGRGCAVAFDVTVRAFVTLAAEGADGAVRVGRRCAVAFDVTVRAFDVTVRAFGAPAAPVGLVRFEVGRGVVFGLAVRALSTPAPAVEDVGLCRLRAGTGCAARRLFDVTLGATDGAAALFVVWPLSHIVAVR